MNKDNIERTGGIYLPVPEERKDMSINRKIDILDKRVKEIDRFLGWINNEQLNPIKFRLNILCAICFFILIAIVIDLY